MKFKKAVKMVSALAQDTRMSVFQLLMQRTASDQGGLPAGVIAETLDVPSATMSFHLNQLTNAGVLKSDKQGRQVIYAIKKKNVKALIRFLSDGETSDGDLELEGDESDDLPASSSSSSGGKAAPAERETEHAL